MCVLKCFLKLQNKTLNKIYYHCACTVDETLVIKELTLCNISQTSRSPEGGFVIKFNVPI